MSPLKALEDMTGRTQNGADTIGVGYVFNAWESVQFYGGWRIHMLERDNISDPDDINAVMIGGRVKF